MKYFNLQRNDYILIGTDSVIECCDQNEDYIKLKAYRLNDLTSIIKIKGRAALASSNVTTVTLESNCIKVIPGFCHEAAIMVHSRYDSLKIGVVAHEDILLTQLHALAVAC